MEELLADLRRSWNVTITGDVTGWVLVLDSEPSHHVYRGTSLARLVTRAWAGERGDV